MVRLSSFNSSQQQSYSSQLLVHSHSITLTMQTIKRLLRASLCYIHCPIWLHLLLNPRPTPARPA